MSIANEYKTIKFKPDEVIFSEGDFGNSAYLVLSGEVHFSVLGNSAHKVIGAGTQNNIFGEMALFNHNTRMATAVAKTHVECVEITEAHIKAQIAETPFLIHSRPVPQHDGNYASDRRGKRYDFPRTLS